MNHHRPIAIVILVVGSMLITSVVVAGWWGGLRLNFTRSYPLGLWRIGTFDRSAAIGDLVFICPPQTAVFEEARSRGYIHHGLCQGRFSPLIKTVVATEGQRIEIGRSVVIDGHVLLHSEVQAADGAGRTLVPFRGGVVPPGLLFLHSDMANSYDSRYFGPIPAKGLLGLAHPIVTFSP